MCPELELHIRILEAPLYLPTFCIQVSLEVLFTSGSTGVPKVVRASHTAVPDQAISIVLDTEVHPHFEVKIFMPSKCSWLLSLQKIEPAKVMTHLLHVVRQHQLQATDVPPQVHIADRTCLAILSTHFGCGFACDMIYSSTKKCEDVYDRSETNFIQFHHIEQNRT